MPQNNSVTPGLSQNRLLSSREVTALLSIHIRTLQKYCKQGRISFIRVGGKHRFRASAVEAFIVAREVPAGRRAA